MRADVYPTRQAMTQLERLQHDGVRRLGSKEVGFRYADAKNKAPGQQTLHRIAALKIPPAWTDVHIAQSGSAKLQAVGKDNAGRWQYRYHPRFVRRQERRKYEQLVRFAKALPKLR